MLLLAGVSAASEVPIVATTPLPEQTTAAAAADALAPRLSARKKKKIAAAQRDAAVSAAAVYVARKWRKKHLIIYASCSVPPPVAPSLVCSSCAPLQTLIWLRCSSNTSGMVMQNCMSMHGYHNSSTVGFSNCRCWQTASPCWEPVECVRRSNLPAPDAACTGSASSWQQYCPCQLSTCLSCRSLHLAQALSGRPLQVSAYRWQCLPSQASMTLQLIGTSTAAFHGHACHDGASMP